MPRKFTFLLVLGLVGTSSLATGAGWAAQYNYLDPSKVDLQHVLAPPPSADSPEGKADLQAVLDAQRTRTPAEVKGAQDDVELTVFRFAGVMGAGFKQENLPFAAIFFQRVFSDENQDIGVAKDHFNRPRPFVADHAIKPVVEQPPNASYPSGHATFAYVDGILLADMVPERAAVIFGRAEIYAHHRVVAGVHYPSDVEAGCICGSVIDNVLLHDARFMADFAKARAEVRHSIGLQ